MNRKEKSLLDSETKQRIAKYDELQRLEKWQIGQARFP
jgi:hypothetical protein